jgi:hypothetical protein
MSLTGKTLGLAAVACLSAGQAVSGAQHGHPPTPPMHATGSAKTTSPAPAPSTTTTTAPRIHAAPPPAVNPIAAKVAMKPQLNARVTAMLPKNMTLNQASSGFKNQGQFIAALHVSRNLGIPFRALKSDMTRKHLSLGQSIQDLKKTSSAQHEARKAENEANEDLKVSPDGHDR